MLLGMLGGVSWFSPPLAGAWACQKFLTKENGLRAGIKQVLLWLFWVNTAAFVVTYYLFQYRAGIWQSLCTLPSFALKYAAMGVAVTGASLAVLAVYPRLTGRLPDLPALPASDAPVTATPTAAYFSAKLGMVHRLCQIPARY